MASKKSIDDYKRQILDQLERAGKRGLTKGKLKISSKSLKEKAFKSLQKSGEIANLGTARSQQWVLARYNQPLEIAYDQIEQIAQLTKGQLYSKTALLKGLKGNIRSKGDEAIRLLCQEKKMLRLKAGRTQYFVHFNAIAALLPAAVTMAAADAAPGASDQDELNIRQAVQAAYQRIIKRDRFGFSDVHIYDLQQESGISMDELKAYLKAESAAGRAVLSEGDWSLSSEAVRSGVIYLDDDPCLLVRFRKEPT